MTSPGAPHERRPRGGAPTVLRAQAVVTPTAELAPGEVVIEDGVIVDVRQGDGADARFAVLLPGFVDLQVNGIGSHDVATAQEGDWAWFDATLLAQGVTTWCPTLTSAPRPALESALRGIAAAKARPEGLRPAIAGAHLEGPFLALPGGHDPAHLEGEVDRDWLAGLSDVVSVVTLSPELPGALAAIGELTDRGVLVALGHSGCSAEEAIEASYAGARLVTHLGNVTGRFHQRAPGLLGAALLEWGLSVALIADLVHVHPVLVGVAFRSKRRDEVVLVTDSVATGPGTGLHVKELAAPEGGGRPDSDPLPRRVACTAQGRIAGSALTMDRALRNAVRHGRASLVQAALAASTNPAQLLGLDDRGAIEVGRRADLVALGGHPREARSDYGVKAVWVGGRRAALPGYDTADDTGG